ncbi:hypothetical protein GAP53_08255 [Bacteroides uniformis]|jgi:hypothetical protein|uniref:Uncharacterized protein n=3 Tax=Bacteroides TaxID=816 RepID=A0AAW7WMS5_9BACE|nr:MULTISPECIES: hypothetical protein [Bacteroides]DAN75206.1 MAG TPA: hypothetical protein [Caudoviricetes sp.]KAB4219449.1 hypothetical protein GAP45_13390 [Bacteroides uniformis]KAB4222922.1 hypothetical protein GAP53_08255 [Bacteroides uniformis]KAB4225226.1 hypothetical protein GAP44_19455 [Bacteroides uniformis]KAB4236268.1 hypothetical protein GAP54_19540 [Bacteroides uniformis]
MKTPKKKNTRQTRAVRQTSPRSREDGRPKGTLKRFPFDETRLGFMLRYEMPVVYYLLRRLCPGQQPFEPDWRVVDSVARASKDPSYRKPKFRRYLEEYSRDGLCCRRAKRLTPGRKAYYEGIRRRKTDAFIRQNRARLEKRNREGPGGGPMLHDIKRVVKKKL